MAPTSEALAMHSFKYDSGTLDSALVEFLQRFYTFSDDKAAASEWAACFTEDAVMKKASTNVSGRTGKSLSL